ncbi:MAG: G protein-coupled receptor LGR4 [Planctomycetia bacterium]|nr:G protein-coupled receptor LGR4 [Planctomycetia bacterium]
MTSIFARRYLCGILFAGLAICRVAAAADSLAEIKTKEDFDALVARSEGTKREALTASAAEILAAVKRKAHVDFVVAALEKAPGKFERVNVTPEALKSAFGSASAPFSSPLFDSLKSVDLGSAALNVKQKREVDPFDQAFYEHLGEIDTLESLVIIHTNSENAWLKPVGKLTSLKVLNIVNQGKLTDEGLAHLAGLKNLERFAYIGTQLKGHPFKDFKGWTNLKSSSFRGSKLDDVGIQAMCEAFPNYETLSLAHAHFTDAGAVHLASLKKLKGLEIASREATPKCLVHITALPLEYLQLGDGLDKSEGIAIVKEMSTLKKFVITGAQTTSDADLAIVAGMKHLEHLELSEFEITEARLPALKEFAFLKSMRIVRRSKPNTPELQAKVKELLSKTDVKFE